MPHKQQNVMSADLSESAQMYFQTIFLACPLVLMLAQLTVLQTFSMKLSNL